jgi:hypothetical protein
MKMEPKVAFLLYGDRMERQKKSVAVIDGQGGGIGSLMLKAGANKGASGENAILQTVKTVDIVIGTTSIILANSMMGELTPKMAEAIASSPAKKCLLPLKIPELEIVGTPKEPLPHLVDQLIKRIQEIIA